MRFAAALLMCLSLMISVSAISAQAQTKYNLISIVTDDQAHWSIGAYGNKETRTPNMDRLAREGARFLKAYTVTPVCSPSRASFLTGKYGTELGITDWISPEQAQEGMGLPISAVTWPQVLQKNGWRTALIGKWHLGEKPQFHPTRRGFDHFYGFLSGGNQPMDPVLEVNGKTERLTGSLPDLLTNEALRFVTESKDRPFALLLHFRAPHTPYAPVPETDSLVFRDLDPTIPPFKGIDVAQTKRFYREYYASVHSVDRNLGRLLALLDELKLTEKTIVMFTSDHGYNIGQHGIHTKGNGFWMAGGASGPKRPNMWDTSLQIPLIIRWLGVVRAGSEITETVTNLDNFASVLGMLNVSLPKQVQQHGLDFSPLLRGEKPKRWRDAVFGQYDLHNGGLAFMRMIRTSEWKLVRHHMARQMDEMYDLQNDPGETRNLYNEAQHRDTRKALQQRLTAWMQSIGDPLIKEKQAR
jgi:uncharacterized sulfatase